MSPVFLFDMGVVIFVIGSAPGEANGLFSVGEVSDEVVVEELTAIIAIKAEDGEREGFFDVFDLLQDSCFTFAPHGALFCPSGGDIGEIHGIGVHAFCGIAAMSDHIGFEESRMGFVPLIGIDRDLRPLRTAFCRIDGSPFLSRYCTRSWKGIPITVPDIGI